MTWIAKVILLDGLRETQHYKHCNLNIMLTVKPGGMTPHGGRH